MCVSAPHRITVWRRCTLSPSGGDICFILLLACELHRYVTISFVHSASSSLFASIVVVFTRFNLHTHWLTSGPRAHTTSRNRTECQKCTDLTVRLCAFDDVFVFYICWGARSACASLGAKRLLFAMVCVCSLRWSGCTVASRVCVCTASHTQQISTLFIYSQSRSYVLRFPLLLVRLLLGFVWCCSYFYYYFRFCVYCRLLWDVLLLLHAKSILGSGQHCHQKRITICFFSLLFEIAAVVDRLYAI